MLIRCDVDDQRVPFEHLPWRRHEGVDEEACQIRHLRVAPLSSLVAPRKLAAFSATLWAVAALTGLVGILLPHGPHVHVIVWVALSVVAGATSLTTFKRGVISSVRIHYVLSAMALVAVSGAIEAAHGSPVVYAVPVLYLLVTIYTASFHPTRSFSIYLFFQAAASALVLIPSGEPGGAAAWGSSILVISTVGVVVHMLRRELDITARTDPLTGLWNRRALEVLLVGALSDCSRRTQELSLAVIDLDNFKAVNDQKGHHVGDQVLQEISASWGKELRKGDILSRSGGDEFVLVLPNTGGTQACEVLRRLGAAGGHSFSSGVVTARPDVPSTLDDLLRWADGACYRAKQAGRDAVTVEVHNDPYHPSRSMTRSA